MMTEWEYRQKKAADRKVQHASIPRVRLVITWRDRDPTIIEGAIAVGPSGGALAVTDYDSKTTTWYPLTDMVDARLEPANA